MKWVVTLLLLAVLGGCASNASEGDSESAEERAERRCRESIGALCDQYVRCKVVRPSSGAAFTDAVCDETLPAKVTDCVDDSGSEISKPNDEDFDACTRALRNEACNLVCNRVPQDPVECLALYGYTPATLSVTCAP